MVKVRVYDSDGVYRGGFFNTDVYNRYNSLVWDGRPQPGHKEYLFDIGNGSWYVFLEADEPDLSGSKECNDLFDRKSKAIHLTPQEALKWFEKQGLYEPPEHLIEQAKKKVHRDIHDLANSNTVDRRWPGAKKKKRRKSKKWVTIKEFCSETDVPSSTAHYWKGKLASEDYRSDPYTNDVEVKRKSLEPYLNKWKERRKRRNNN